MTRLRKVYLPKWMTWFGLLFLVPTWALITYQVLFVGDSEIGIVGWILVTVFFAIMAVVLILMGRRELPAYLLEVDEQDGG